MMLHQDGSRHAWLEGQPALDLIVTLDDATSAIYSAFLVEEEGTASTFRALKEVFGAHGLPMSLYTDRGSHYFHTPKAAARSTAAVRPRSGGRWSIWASSISRPIRRRRAAARSGCSRRLQDRLAKELALAGIATVEAANAFLRDVYLPAHNARFAVEAAQRGLGLRADPGRRSRRDPVRPGGAPGRQRQLRLLPNAETANPAKARCAPHFVKARVKVHVYPDGSHAIFHGPRCLGRYDEKERSRTAREKRRLNPLGGEPVDGMDKPPACPPRPQENKTRRSGHLMCYQNRTT